MISNMYSDLLDVIVRIIKYIGFLIGHAFARMRRMGQVATDFVDSTLEGFTYGEITGSN